MALSANQKEEAYIQAFIKTLKDLAKNGDQLNGAQLKGVEGMTKWMTQMSNNNTTTKANLKIEKDKFTLGKKELEVRERLKKSDEHLVQLRHKLNIEMEREHGDQVRRNINLRHNMDSFNDKFEMLKKSLTGGFGFQAAMDKTVKDLGGMTRTFQENKDAQEKYKEAVKTSAEALQKMQIAFLGQDPAEMEEAKQELSVAKKGEARTKIDVENTQEEMEKKGIAGKLKPMFAKLDKVGEFLGKKALPIGLGVGVAGVLMSVIVKSFSASPLFAAMMKLIKFSVQLILMPIGTFFGALLRPILITLLRKFIIPFYSTWMPRMMSLGTQAGNFLVDPIGYIMSNGKSDGKTDEEEAVINEEIKKTTNKTAWDEFTNDPLGFIWRSFNLPTSDNVLPPVAAEEEKATVDWDMSGENPMFNGKTPSDIETPAEKQVREDKEARDRAALMESDQERTNRELAEAAADKADREAWEHADKAHWMEINRSVLDMNKLMETNGIITEAIPKAMTQEMTNFAAYGMNKPEKGGDIHDAGANIAAANAKNASAGYTMGGTTKSQSILEAYNAFKNGVTAANGFDGMVNSPTMFLAGEAGSEHVTVTPNGQGGGSSIVVNIGTMNGSDNDLRKLKQTILEVIQESSANRGRL